MPEITASLSENIRARSFLPGFLIAASTAEKRKPLGVFIITSYTLKN
jgi:hypothetical protein